jgi:hypothetical protein
LRLKKGKLKPMTIADLLDKHYDDVQIVVMFMMFALAAYIASIYYRDWE